MKWMKPCQAVAFFLLATLLFALAYNQSPLYTSNQHQYFLHGLAGAGVGGLSEDWLAQTVDPTPVFSWIVEITASIGATPAFFVYYALLMGVYLFSLASIAGAFLPLQKPSTRFLFLGAMILLHSAGLRYLFSQTLGPDWSYLLEGGVAGQRLLGPVFQPSVFGVLLLLSIALYLQRRTTGAVLVAVLAASIHPTYLLSAALLIGTYLVDKVLIENRMRQAAGMTLLALVAVSPILIHTIVQFTGGSAETAARARDILVNIRIPHHARVADWLDWTTLARSLLLGIALFLVRRHKLLLLMALPLGAAVLLTTVQVISADPALALLFPWRISTWLMPIALAVIVWKLVLRAEASLPTRWMQALKVGMAVTVVCALVVGMIRTRVENTQAASSPAIPVQKYVAEYRQPGELYLIPVKMYDFRLNAQAPAYGDFFSIPYQYQEVITWYSRFLNAKHFYESGDCSLLDGLFDQGVTHVILPADFPGRCRSLTPVYQDDAYGVFVPDSD
jgi:hypothetical protein